MRKILPMLLAAMLAGCATDYVAPVDKPTVPLAFVGNGGQVDLFVYDNTACKHIQYVGVFGSAKWMKTRYEIQVPAGQTVAIYLRTMTSMYNGVGLSMSTSELTLDFDAVAGMAYELDFNPAGTRIYRIDPALPEGRAIETSTRKQPKQCSF